MLLKQFIQLSLNEAALNHLQLPENINVTIEKSSDDFSIYFSDEEGMMTLSSDSAQIWGEITIGRSESEACENTFEVIRSSAKSGWGPFLYDIAIEVATLNGDGLIPDRNKVSPAATKVWEYYLNQRNDVKKHRLSNDCNSNAGDSPAFEFRFTKNSTTIDNLKSMKRLHNLD